MEKFVQHYHSKMIKWLLNVKQLFLLWLLVFIWYFICFFLYSISEFLGHGFQVQFDGIRAYVRLDPSFVNNTRGLCGTYDFNSQNDFLTHIAIVETDIKTFVDDYKTDSTCITPVQQNPCKQYYNVCIIKNLTTIK